MRRIDIIRSTADLHRLDFIDQPVASFYVNEGGISHVEFGDEEIPRSVAVFDPADKTLTRVTLESDPVRWAELLPLAYRSGDYRIAVTATDHVPAAKSASVDSGIAAELEAIPV